MPPTRVHHEELGGEFAEVVSRLVDSIEADHRILRASTQFLPDRTAILDATHRLTWLVFPGFFGPRDLGRLSMRDHVTIAATDVRRTLAEQISAALRYERHLDKGSAAFAQECAQCDAKAATILVSFFNRLPEVRRLLSLDVQAAFDGDPAARHTDEIVFSYPGVRALCIHRMAHELYRLDVPLVPRIMSEFAHSQTGIDIHPGARIGASFFIDHGTGVVIGETSVIGDHCRIYQGVTLGAASFPKDERGRLKRGIKRHPTLEDHVTIYAGATLLGGTTVIGAGSVINGGVFVTSSVPPGHIVRAPRGELTLRNNPDLPPANFTI